MMQAVELSQTVLPYMCDVLAATSGLGLWGTSLMLEVIPNSRH